MIEDHTGQAISTVAIWKHRHQRGIQPWWKKMWGMPRLTPELMARMEHPFDR